MSHIAYFFSKENSRVRGEIAALNSVGQDIYEGILYNDLVAVIKKDVVDILKISEGTSVLKHDLAFHRTPKSEDMRGAVTLLFDLHNKPFLNDECIHMQYISKLQQYMQFAFNGLPFPDSIVARGDMITGSLIAEHFTLPVVVKAIRGNSGDDNHLITEPGDLVRLNPEEYYVAQPYIANRYDYRIIVADDNLVLAYKRVRTTDTHLNNITTGATREYVESLDPQLLALAIRAAKVLGRNLAGVDVLMGDDGRPYVLEVNFSYGVPQFGGEIFNDVYIKRLSDFFAKKAAK